jgi:predicted RNA-binding protein YlxR (DUF448 family)
LRSSGANVSGIPASTRKSLRVRHVPQRMCVACRAHSAKRALVRIVRTQERDIQVDLTGRLNGRGAYLCDQAECWSKAIATPVLARSLNIELTQLARDRLTSHAATLNTNKCPQDGEAVGEE